MATDEVLSRLEKQVKAKKAADAAKVAAKVGGKAEFRAKAPKTVKTILDRCADDIDSGLLWTVWDARQVGYSFNQLEEAFDLDRQNGNQAWRIVKKAEKVAAFK